MRNFPQRLLRNAIFLLAWTVASALAEDLDTFLALPPSASLTPDDASHRVEMLRALIASHPDRADEIEAYLIPFVRAMHPPVAEPTPTPAPAAAAAKPLLLVKPPGGVATLMRALSYRRQGAVVIAAGEKASLAVFQANTLFGELPWYSSEEIDSGAVDLADVASRYEKLAATLPLFRPMLNAEAVRFRTLQAAREKAASDRRNAIDARIAGVTSAAYDPASGYTAASLAKMLLEAEKARNEWPDQAAKIDAWAGPFQRHFAELLSGRSYINGEWVSNAELARQAREKRQAEFLNGLDYQLGLEAASAGAVRGLVQPLLLAAALALGLGAGLAIFGRRWIWLRVGGIALVALAPLTLASIFFLATRNPPLLPATIGMADERPIVDALSQAVGLDANGAASQKISDAVLNAFLARHVRIKRTGAGGAEVPERQAVALRLLPGRIAIFQVIHDAGLNWIVRLDLNFRQEGGRSSFALAGARIGALDCPAALATDLWRNLEPQLSAIVGASRITDRFSVQSPGVGFVEIRPLAPKDETSAANP